MNKKLFTGLIVLMGISILGIIAVQLVWMNQAIRVKNEMFERSVNEALIRTVNRLEDIHNLSVVNEMIFSDDSALWAPFSGTNFDFDADTEFVWRTAPLAPPQPTGKPVKIIRQVGPNKKNAVIEIKMNNDSTRAKQTFTYNVSTTASANNHVVVAANNTHSNATVFVREDTIITDMDSLYTISTIKIDSLLTELDTFKILRPDLSKRIHLKAGNLKKLANRMVTEVSAWDVRKVDEELISETLKKELEESDIPLDFEFGIIRDSITEFPMEVSDSAAVVNTNFQVELYPNDIFQKNLKLALFFPGKDGFIYRSLNWLLVASFLFSMFILVTFALSIFYILRQKKISEMKSDFINNMTHEFKTPIATISVATDSITNDKVLGDPERIRYFAGMIKKENTRMNRQVEDILTIARLDRKDFEFNWEAIDVHDLIKDAVQGIILQVEKRSGRIDLDLQAMNPMITTDRNHCTNVVYNLIDNANKYSPDTPEIKVRTRNLQNGVLISVEDKGIGMSKVVQSKIFERFYRQTSGNIHNVKGFGLGLSYVKAVLEANRGNISVQSEPGKGSKFDVFLPFVRE
ncbi:HAMP domain-containing sensor histidine kinase [Maribellus sp. YY47]|uniref:sensor histidine kinase n=1 Tax=Maribellus sp. YY47 TaxID=2929486 RepID=UPI002000F925|nr:HAMP domain-containing sensor histidine kinase [Maribellus sp. YY47]MCK3682523.1 HAMP domain-containing histidine kinase [Maribellus sp. YY47]